MFNKQLNSLLTWYWQPPSRASTLEPITPLWIYYSLSCSIVTDQSVQRLAIRVENVPATFPRYKLGMHFMRVLGYDVWLWAWRGILNFEGGFTCLKTLTQRALNLHLNSTTRLKTFGTVHMFWSYIIVLQKLPITASHEIIGLMSKQSRHVSLTHQSLQCNQVPFSHYLTFAEITINR